MTDFVNLADGGARLAPLVSAALDADGAGAGVAPAGEAVLLAAMPNGVPVALAIAAVTGLEVRALPVLRSESGAVVEPVDGVAGRRVVVVDDGVETGTVARAAALGLRASGVASLILAVPVCPREAAADLQQRYDAIIAAVRPLARRDLAWHYADFDTIDEPEARARLTAAGF